MHELSIADGIAQAAIASLASLAEEGEGRVISVRVEVGALSGVVPESLVFCFGEVCRGTRLEGATLEILPVPLEVLCSTCGKKSILQELSLLCPHCESVDVHVVRGRELRTLSLDLATSEGNR